MSRGPRRKIGLLGAMIAILIMGGALLAFFSTASHELFQRKWPLGIEQREVGRYVEVFDLRRVESQLAEPKGEPFLIGALEGNACNDPQSAEWTTQWFEAQGYGDTVQVRAIAGSQSGFEVRFKDEAPFRDQQRIQLRPATPEHIRMKYAEVLATELGMATPMIGFVRMLVCGRDKGVYVAEEVIGEGFLARRRLNDAQLFQRSFDPGRPEHLFPEMIGDTTDAALLRSMLAMMQEQETIERLDRMGHTLDQDATAAWFLMLWLEGAPDPLHQVNAFLFHPGRGRFTPLHTPSHIFGKKDASAEASPWSINAFTPWLKLPAFQEQIAAKRKALLDDRGRIEEAFTAVDSLWLPVLANDEAMASVQSAADRQKQEIFQRLAEGDPIAFLDRPMVPLPGSVALLRGQATAKRYWPTESDLERLQTFATKYKARLAGDSLIFPRGKYMIDEDLIVPPGHALILLSGARLFLSPGVNILCQGPLHVRGSRLNPVFIRPAGGAFGTFAMMGDGDMICSIHGLQISGGAGARINGVQHPGMVSVQDASQVSIKDCVISAPAGDVAFHVEGGTLRMEENSFVNSRLELRKVDAEMMTNIFQGGSRISGMAIHDSKLTMEECRFWSINGTALEITDGTRALVKNSNFDRCGTAIAASDLATVHLVENTISGNRNALSAQRNKPLYGGAKIHVYPGNRIVQNSNERQADEHSSITDEAGAFDERVMEEQVTP